MSGVAVFQLVVLIAQLLSLALLIRRLVVENGNIARTTKSLNEAFTELEKAKTLSRQLQVRLRETGTMSPKSHDLGRPS
jgi:hypothetical protein